MSNLLPKVVLKGDSVKGTVGTAFAQANGEGRG
jgi:hypothetical protein